MRLVLLGDPVDHSLSPAIQNAALRAASLPGAYEARLVDERGLADAFDEMRSGVIDGANVTMPHKGRAAALADRLEPTAQRAGAINTLVRVAGDVIGHNTDVAGIRRAWADRRLPDAEIVQVLGTGAAAAAALLALEGRDLVITTRRVGAGTILAKKLRVTARELPWGTAVPGAVLVNATPLGMHGEALPNSLTDEASGLFDMAYGSEATPAVAEMRTRNLPAVDGTDMLLAQGAASFRLWTGRSADLTAMRAAMVATIG